LVQNADGAVASGFVTGDRAAVAPPTFLGDCTSTPQLIRCSASSDDLQVTPFVGGSLEIMTPAPFDLPGHPRLFAHGDAAALFPFDRDFAKEGLPDAFEPQRSELGPILVTENSVMGQGSQTSAKLEPWLLSAGLGVAFTFEVGERRLRLKPSVEWVREEIEVEGVVQRAVQTAPSPPLDTVFPQGFRFISLDASDKKTYNGIGPGLELEMDTVRTGPLMMTVYLAGQAYSFLGDLEVELSDSEIPPCTSATLCSSSFPNPPPPETATWSFEKERWAFRGGVGLRFRWLPEE
jgi:hypothetical protein